MESCFQQLASQKNDTFRIFFKYVLGPMLFLFLLRNQLRSSSKFATGHHFPELLLFDQTQVDSLLSKIFAELLKVLNQILPKHNIQLA